MLLGLAAATVFRRRVVRHLRVSRAVVLSAQVRCGCVGPQYVVPTLGGGEGWVGRPPDALIDVLGAQKQLFRVPGAAGGHRCRI